MNALIRAAEGLDEMQRSGEVGNATIEITFDFDEHGNRIRRVRVIISGKVVKTYFD